MNHSCHLPVHASKYKRTVGYCLVMAWILSKSFCSGQYWVAVKELKLRDYPPTMENQMEKKMDNEMETGGI